MDAKEHITLQYKSVLMVQFISNYAKLEKLIIRMFQNFIITTEHRHKSKLYFMYGCTVGNDVFYAIESVQKRNLAFPFHDCILKFISMRNKLAHELDKIAFKDSDIIETLSVETIKKFTYVWSEDWDFNMMDNDCILIYSNLVYIFAVLNIIDTNS